MFQPPSHLPNISIPLPDTITSDQLNVSQLSRLIQTHFTPSFAPHLIPINVVAQQTPSSTPYPSLSYNSVNNKPSNSRGSLLEAGRRAARNNYDVLCR